MSVHAGNIQVRKERLFWLSIGLPVGSLSGM